MKYNCWLIFGAMLSTSLLAQQVTNSPPSAPIATPAAAPAAKLAPAAATKSAPAAKTGKKKAAKKKAEKAPVKKAVAKQKTAAPVLRTVPLVPGPAVVDANHVNVRGQARLKSEVVTRMTKGQAVTVIEEIVRNNSGPDEPSAWAKIVLPSNAHAWVHTAYLDTSNQTVKVKKLNLRGGPGENYSVIGRLQSGDAVKTVTTKGDWTEIETSAKAYAFVAAQYLKQEAPAVLATAPMPTTLTPTPTPTPTPTEPAPTPTDVAAVPLVAAPPTETPVVSPATETPAVANPAPTVVDAPVADEPLPPRIVQREGIVRGNTSIQAPSQFVLISPENGKNIDYLYTASKELDLRRYKGLRIIVTGEEGLDERWENTPVLTIQRIQVVE